MECAVSLLQEVSYRWWDAIIKVVASAKVTLDFFLMEFRKKYISCVHEEEQNRSGDQQKKVFGQSSNKRPRESLSQMAYESRRQRPRPMSRVGQLESPIVSTPGIIVGSSILRKCGHCKKWHKGECRGLTRACYRCGAMDHFMKDCPQRRLYPMEAQEESGPHNEEATPGSGEAKRKQIFNYVHQINFED